jgi:hypothetical protein
MQVMVNRILPRFSGTFKLECPAYGPSADLSSPGLPIKRENMNIDYGGRRSGYVSTIQKLAKAVEKKLPENVLVALAIGHWGGSSAYDTVSIRILSPDKKQALAEDRFFRSINEYDGLNPEMFVPKIIRDNLFSTRVMWRAKSLVAKFNKNPEATQKNYPPSKNRDNLPDSGEYTGLW